MVQKEMAPAAAAAAAAAGERDRLRRLRQEDRPRRAVEALELVLEKAELFADAISEGERVDKIAMGCRRRARRRVRAPFAIKWSCAERASRVQLRDDRGGYRALQR